MKNTLQQPALADEQPAQGKTIVLKYYAPRSRGTVDVSHQYFLALAGGIESYCKENGYLKLMDITPGVVELYDRGASDSMHDCYLVVVYVSNPGQPRYTILVNVESFDLIMALMCDDNLLKCIPLLPDMLRRFHGISV